MGVRVKVFVMINDDDDDYDDDDALRLSRLARRLACLHLYTHGATATISLTFYLTIIGSCIAPLLISRMYTSCVYMVLAWSYGFHALRCK